MNKKHGFTLIELSIVLVIVALLVAGVLVGRDLIKAAEIRQTVSQLSGFKTAVNTFRSKYNCLPGDCAKAVAFGLGTTGGDGDDGDGNSQICDNTTQSTGAECSNFWYHLSQSAMVAQRYAGHVTGNAESGVDSPRPNINLYNFDGGGTGGWWMHHGIDNLGQISKKHFFSLYNTQCGNDQPAIVAPEQAYALDSKVDDGMPLSGTAQAWYDDSCSQHSFFPPSAGSALGEDNYGIVTVNGRTIYNFTNSSIDVVADLLILSFDAGF